MSSNNITIGIDLGDRRHAVCVLSAAGDILAETEVINTRECLCVFVAQYPGATCVMTDRRRQDRPKTSGLDS